MPILSHLSNNWLPSERKCARQKGRAFPIQSDSFPKWFLFLICPSRARGVKFNSALLSPSEQGRSVYAAAQADAVTIGCDASISLPADTLCPDSIHFGATFRSSSGRFIVNAATTCCRRNHHTLKLLLDRSPRCTT